MSEQRQITCFQWSGRRPKTRSIIIDHTRFHACMRKEVESLALELLEKEIEKMNEETFEQLLIYARFLNNSFQDKPKREVGKYKEYLHYISPDFNEPLEEMEEYA